VDPLLGNDLETNNKTISAAGQQILYKQVYAAVTELRLGKEACFDGKDWSNNGIVVFCLSIPMGYKEDSWIKSSENERESCGIFA
jgi:hypothetical protein